MHSSFALLLTTSLPFAASGVPKDTRSYMSVELPNRGQIEDHAIQSVAFVEDDRELVTELAA